MSRPPLPRLAFALATLAGSQAVAAPAPAPPQVTEVKVTARRRSELLQHVPVADTVVSGAQARRENRNDLAGILRQVPAADFRTNSSEKDRTIFIRGIGTISTSPGVEPSVSTVVDGVVLARSGQATLDLFDASQVEVLRGPQGTLFGLNSSAGVVNITTLAPTAQTHGFLEGAFYECNEYRVDGGISGSLTDTLTGRLDVLTGDYAGNVHNNYGGGTLNGYGHWAARGKLDWISPDGRTHVRLDLDYTRSTETVPNGVFVSASQIAFPTDHVTTNRTLANVLAAEGIDPASDNRTVSNDEKSRSNDNNGGAAITTNTQLGEDTLTTVTAFRAWQNTQWQDYDQNALIATGLPRLADVGNLSFTQFSEEDRIASPKGGLIDYVGGLFYLHDEDTERYDRSFDGLLASGAPQAVSGDARYGTVEDNVALFGEGDLNITKRFRLIAGLRTLDDNLSYHFGRVSTAPAAVSGIAASFRSTGSTNWFGYEDRLGLQYDLTDNVMSYFTYSRGFKGPAYNVFFNMAPASTGVLKPETSDDYEIGLKSRLLHGRLQANFAFFLEDFQNFQANFLSNVAGALVTNLVNAGSVSTRGIEADIAAAPIRNVTLTLAGAYTDAHVDQFNCPAGAPTSCNINGEPLPFAPRWKLDFRAEKLIPLTTRLRLSLDSDFIWQSNTQYQLTETPDTVQTAYGIWDLSVSLANLANGWRITGLMNNVLDTHYSSYLADGNFGGVVRFVPRDDTRYVGVQARKDF